MTSPLQATNAAAIGAALWDSADFAGAAHHFERGLAESPNDLEALLGLGRLRLAQNDLAGAVLLLEHAVSAAQAVESPSRAELVARARRDLAWGYYRLDRFDLAAEQLVRLPGQGALVAQCRALADATPYALSRSDEIALPFLGTDPLPIVTVVLGGQEHAFVLDTGAGQLVIDRDLAAELALPNYGSREVTFASGQRAPIGHTLLPEMALGETVLRDVPAEVMEVRRFAPQISGFLGTSFLQRFHVLCDWKGQLLRLMPRTPRPRDADDQSDPPPWLDARAAMTTVPFLLLDDHLIVAPASINDHPTMAYIASGMAGAAFTTPPTTARQAALVAAGTLDAVSAAGSAALESIVASSLCLGEWCRPDQEGLLGFFPDELEWRYGFRIGTLVGQEFLLGKRWLLDFDRMVMGFA